MKVDYQLLEEDVKFPLKWGNDDYKVYIFDKYMNMIASVEVVNKHYKKDKHPFHSILGKMRTEEKPVEELRFFLDQGDFYDREFGVRIGCVRGWGKLQQKDNAEARQDNIANYILNCLNKLI